MAIDEFIAYAGDPDFHDGSVVSVVEERDSTRVVVRGASGQEFVVEFRGVKAMRSCKPEGMLIYSLSEMKAQPPARRFEFANWHEDDDAFFSIDAEDFSVARLG